MISEIIDKDKLIQAVRAIDGSNNIVITAHISPDGDAMGSSLAMYHLLKRLHKNVTIVLNDMCADNLAWLPGSEFVLTYEENRKEAYETIAAADLIFCMDFNAPKRMGRIENEILAATGMKVLIDHHLYPGDFCDIVISYPKMTSTCELVYHFLMESGKLEYMNKEIATCLYTGMMTDTGAFTYNSNSPELYIIISKLLAFDIDKDHIYDLVNNTFSETRERLMGYTISEKMRVYPAYQAAMIDLSKEELKNYKYKKGDTEGFVNIPLSVKGVVFSVFFREDCDYIKVSLR